MAKHNKAQQVHMQPSVRISTSWTPSLIRACLNSADGGYIANAAALCDVVMADERVQQDLETVVGGVFGLDLSFEPGKGTRSAEAVTALEDDWWLAFPESEATQVVNWGIMLGVGFGQKVWEQENGRLIPKLRFWHPRHARWDWAVRAWFMRTAEGEIQIDPEEREWIVFCPYGDYRPWALGKWRGVSEWWLVKDYARMDWARTGEGASTRVAFQDVTKAGAVVGADDDMRKDLAASIDALGSDGTITLPPGWDMKILGQAATSYQIYSAQVDMANMSFDIALKGQNLTTQVEGGSRAAADVHERVESRVIRFVAKRIESDFREQSLAEWAEVNYGNADAAPWPQFKTEEDEDANEKADRFGKISAGLEKAKKAGFSMEPKEIEEQFGFKFTVVEEPEPDTDPGANGGAGGGKSGQGGSNGGGSKATANPGADGAHGARAGVPVRSVRAESELGDGPEYAGRLIESGRDAAPGELVDLVATALALVEEATATVDPDDPVATLRAVRERVRDEYAASAAPHELARIMERHLILARLAGMLAVREEDGGLDPDADA